MRIKRQRKAIAFVIAFLTLWFAIDTGMKAYSQTQRRNEIKEEQTFQRPEPSRPVSPEVPQANRYQEDKVFLEYADSLYKLNDRDTIQKQILKGNVKFRQSGLWMFCDSAYYYPDQNSLDAFSNVRMEQGDTLFVYADKLFYNGNEHFAQLKNGPTREKVTLINNDVTLTTDSLDYDMAIDLGWYMKWGTIDDKVNTLTSLYGQYSPKTKRAEFYTDVVLVNQKDGFTMLTDTLYYNTATHIANIESRTEIQSENDTIITNLATYYTDTGDADLLSRSLIIHKDSTGNVTTLEGDSIIYDSSTRISRAYMYQDPFKRSTPMVITDTAQKTTLIGGFGIYNDSTKEALATIYPLLMEYSKNDTLFLRADTIKTFIVTVKVPDKRRRTKSGFPEYNGNPIVKFDSLGIWIDTMFFSVKIPFVETPLNKLLKEMKVDRYPSSIDSKSEENDSIDFPTLLIRELESVSDTIPNEHPEILDIVELTDSIGQLNIIDDLVIEREDSIPLDSLPIALSPKEIRIQASNPDSISSLLPAEEIEYSNEETQSEEIPDSISQEFHVILAYHRGRFFKQDMQGVADSLVLVEHDSMLYMFRKPIIWSEERQITGNRIDIHFNDSTTDWAYLPEFGLMSEHVDEDFYNQIYGKEITTYFEGQGLRRMEVSGNVETIFLPQEADSTFNRLVNAESSYMDVYLNENQLDWLKMWPEVNGTVTPIFLVKRNQMYLQKFKWWGFLRPEREWYGNKVRWADNLGEVPEELEQYFLAPSDFGEPKSFTGPRIILPPTSLPDISEGKTIVSEIDSLSNDKGLQMELPDSISEGETSLGVKEAENIETLENIENSENDLEEELKETELQSEEILNANEEESENTSNSELMEQALPVNEEERREGDE